MRYEKIRIWTSALILSLGRPRSPVSPTRLEALYAAKDWAGMLRLIRKELRLDDIRLRLGLVNSGGPVNAPAWMIDDDALPMYGTREFRDYPVTMFIKKRFLAEAPMGTVVAAMSHELSHVVLGAIRHELRYQEEAVDLTAMLLGFREFFLNDCSYEVVQGLHVPEPKEDGIFGMLKHLLREDLPEVEVTTHNLGYLTHEERHYASWIMANWP